MSTPREYQPKTAEQYIKEAEQLRIAAMEDDDLNDRATHLQRATHAIQLAGVCATLEAAGLRPTEFQAGESQ